MMRSSITRIVASAAFRPRIPAINLQALASKRTFTSLPSLRPNLRPITRAIGRPTSLTPTMAQISLPTTGAAGDPVPQTSITTHPAFLASQIRCTSRNTMNRNSRLKRKRKHGFLSRNRTKNGRKMLLRRRLKGRLRLSS